jgi:formate dehydrogenase subunit gamma
MLQPASTQAPADVAARTAAVVEELSALEGPLLPILHGLQEEFGYVPRESLPIVARALNISDAEAHGVASFYHDYRKAPAGRHVLKMCRAEACQSMGSDAMAERMEQLLGIRFGQTSADGSVTLEAVYCLGLCACGPSALLDGQPIGRLDDGALRAIAAEVRA